MVTLESDLFFSRLTSTDNHILGSIRIQKTCNMCTERNDSNNQSQTTLPIVPTELSGLQLEDIESYIMNSHDRISYCTLCIRQLSITRTYANIVALDVEADIHVLSKISDIKATIHLDNITYDLFGVVQFNPSNDHFVAHIKRRNGSWQTFDDLKGRIQTLSNITNVKMYVFMVFYMKRDLN